MLPVPRSILDRLEVSELKIVVVGGGEVGYMVAQTLSSEGHDVTVVEEDEERADKVDSELDVITVRGNGARPQVLEEAGVCPGCQVDLLVACTNHDEVNILACWIAKRAGVKRVISRARGLEFTDSPTWAKDLGIDVMYSPERSVAREILELLSVRSTVHTGELMDGRWGVYAFRVARDSKLVGVALRDLKTLYPNYVAIIVYIEREGRGYVPHGDITIESGDLCYIVTSREDAWRLEEVYQGHRSRPLRKVIIVGGGKIGFQVARQLEERYPSLDVRLIDHDEEKCERIAGELKRTLVLKGDGADDGLLRQEGIEEADGLVCATESDEANLLFAVIGKALGARKTVAVARRKLYAKLDSYMSVDSIVNPNSALASLILRHARYPGGSGVLSIIDKIDAEMFEAVLPEDSPAVGRPIIDLGLPKGIIVALAERRGHVFVPVGSSILMPGDRVIVFATADMMDDAIRYLGVN
ncbi:Trk system potassium transporter TrkA [Thermanaerovibrio acidaminovorans]|uniref:Trk system potassium transporter TrkA n=1 Tax=Thermanaerovibrio acidaminovorans TaxID=81462 RepID=UPI0030FEFE22